MDSTFEYGSNSKGSNPLETTNGGLAEWLGGCLQNSLHKFESCIHLIYYPMV
jgi:hypothetical protein